VVVAAVLAQWVEIAEHHQVALLVTGEMVLLHLLQAHL
tara:strand:- start:228 stop:341 length:114 start_codon:yes stop_codon:yes gene_type:complete